MGGQSIAVAHMSDLVICFSFGNTQRKKKEMSWPKGIQLFFMWVYIRLCVILYRMLHE